MLTNERIHELAGPADYYDRLIFARAIEADVAAPLLARIAELEHEAELRRDLHRTANVMIGERDSRIEALTAQADQDSAPAKEDPRKLRLQGLILASVRLGLAQPSESLLHQLDRLIDFYEDDKFADALRLLRHSVRNPKMSRRIPLIPSVEPAESEQHPEMVEQAAQPVAWRHSKTFCLYETEEEVPLADGDELAEPLYTAPPKAAPLTEDVLKEMHHEDQFGLFCDYDDFEQIARAVEQAHGIGTPATVKKG